MAGFGGAGNKRGGEAVHFSPPRRDHGRARMHTVQRGLVQPRPFAADHAETTTDEGYSCGYGFYPPDSQRGAVATKAAFSLRRAGRHDGPCFAEASQRTRFRGDDGDRRKEYPTIRGWRPRLHRTRFLTKVVTSFPDATHPV